MPPDICGRGRSSGPHLGEQPMTSLPLTAEVACCAPRVESGSDACTAQLGMAPHCLGCGCSAGTGCSPGGHCGDAAQPHVKPSWCPAHALARQCAQCTPRPGQARPAAHLAAYHSVQCDRPPRAQLRARQRLQALGLQCAPSSAPCRPRACRGWRGLSSARGGRPCWPARRASCC